ncbi:hypothetical protein MKK84_17940 [Methylobacterium sp. E-065]|uniref:hypothetical protein n=2 Tax=Methylobacterium TaxID=407 RepID=UPI001FBB86A5|nr:hypothetical protein [Methylobacterium sp. E-065]MCJ2019296.1 hypothetical protein [Methylobacterium sp. E-065]
MPETAPERIAPYPPPRERMIRRIAEALGRPETVFRCEGASGSEFADQGELLRIWESLTDHADRQRILAFARGVASERSGVIRP